MAKYYQGVINNMVKKLKDFEPYVKEYLNSYLSSTAADELLTEMIANNQLYRRGIEGYGRKIMSYAPYAVSTIRYKKRKGQPHTRVTLKDTGDFYSGFKVITTSAGFYITSDDKKTKWLVNKYGESIFRITNENFKRFIDKHVRKDLAKYLKSKYKTR